MAIARMTTLAAALAATTGLAACSGGSTYGTGVSQEVQLLQDIGGLASIGGSKKKKAPINYSARPDLVQVPANASLPAPVENVASADPNFPLDDDARRAAIRANGYDPLAAVTGAATGDGATDATFLAPDDPNRPQIERARIDPNSPAVNHTRVENPLVEARRREAVLARRKALSAASGAAPRKYLTDPPVEYRTPAPTAEVGNPGEREPRPRASEGANHSDPRDPLG